MKFIHTILAIAFFVFPLAALGADKDKLQLRMDSTVITIENVASRSKGSSEINKDLDQARSYLKQSQESYQKGKQFFGGIKPEAEEEVAALLDMTDLSLVIATSRIEKARATVELEPIEKKLAANQVIIKRYEDKKAEMEKLREESKKFQAAFKEIETLKLEKDALSTQLKQLTEERTATEKMKEKYDEQTKALEEARASVTRLTEQLDSLKAGVKSVSADTESSPKVPSSQPYPATSLDVPEMELKALQNQ